MESPGTRRIQGKAARDFPFLGVGLQVQRQTFQTKKNGTESEGKKDQSE